MIKEKYAGYEINVIYPPDYKEDKKYPALILNDGDKISEWEKFAMDCFIFGIVPNDRLNDYTPWEKKALRKNTADFGGGAKEYIYRLDCEVIPKLSDKYKIAEDKLIFGGFSLGGLAAVYSLYLTERFRYIFSVCGSFWYPDFAEFVQREHVVNKDASVFLINGKAEGSNHNNILEKAPQKAQIVHDGLRAQIKSFTGCFDNYGHHENMTDRIMKVRDWILLNIS